MITQLTFDFLRDLARNNYKDWFDENKVRYEHSKSELVNFAENLIQAVSQYDQISTSSGKKCLYRIFRDVRFSKDKTPYKTHWSGGLARATAYRRGGFYFQIEPGATFIGGGFWGPNSEDLLHLRKQIEADAAPLRKVLESKTFKSTWGELHGDKVKTAPKGFSKEHENIDLLRHKSFIVRHDFTDKEVLSPDFVDKITSAYFDILPFFDVMTQYLTTNLNGENILQK